MSNRKTYNSIVFLTVYLGLALVGASPQVLAQAALTQKIAEVQSDAENKSNDKDCWNGVPKEVTNSVKFDYLSYGILEFVHGIQKLIETGKYNIGEDFDFYFEIKKMPDDGLIISNLIHSGNELLRQASWEKSEILVSNSYFRYDSKINRHTSYSTVRFTSDNGDLTIKISQEKETAKGAEGFANIYNNRFNLGRCSKYVEAKPKIIYSSSKAFTENNQVFIVTRLPRASIDKLLAQKDAQ